MKLGLIVRSDNRGLGIQTWEAYRHFEPFRTMVVDHSQINRMQNYPERFTEGDIMHVKGAPSPAEVNRFLQDLDAVFTCETPYSYYLLSRAREVGVKTLVQPNYEYNGWTKPDSKLPLPHLFGLPTKWHWDDFPKNKVLLPVPIALDRFKFVESDSCTRLLHIVGRPAANDRNGTYDLVQALKHVKSQIHLTITCQVPDYIYQIQGLNQLPRNVSVTIDTTAPDNYWELYAKGYDAMVMPRRYGGLCLPVNEALGAGMPVIMPDISPNNDWLPNDWLVPAQISMGYTTHINKVPIDVYKVEPKDLAAKIDQFAGDIDFYKKQQARARELAHQYSWDELGHLYVTVFQGMLQA